MSTLFELSVKSVVFTAIFERIVFVGVPLISIYCFVSAPISFEVANYRKIIKWNVVASTWKVGTMKVVATFFFSDKILMPLLRN